MTSFSPRSLIAPQCLKGNNPNHAAGHLILFFIVCPSPFPALSLPSEVLPFVGAPCSRQDLVWLLTRPSCCSLLPRPCSHSFFSSHVAVVRAPSNHPPGASPPVLETCFHTASSFWRQSSLCVSCSLVCAMHRVSSVPVCAVRCAVLTASCWVGVSLAPRGTCWTALLT